MKTIADPIFLAWAAHAGLIPDPRYPASRQLVFATAPNCWIPYARPATTSETAAFVGAAIHLIADAQPVRVRLRGGGRFSVDPPHSKAEAAIASAVSASGLPPTTTGAVEFDLSERDMLVPLAVAFSLWGHSVGTDLEIVNLRRDACLLFGHHGEILAHFSNQSTLDLFRTGMTDAGFWSELDE